MFARVGIVVFYKKMQSFAYFGQLISLLEKRNRKLRHVSLFEKEKQKN
jgi:hypothetical protein